jgi:DNA-binding LacI/PurR family transcriptional regulator
MNGRGNGMKKVTLQTIADKLNVSKALVSKALANDPAVSNVTKEVIWKTAEDMNYRMKSPKKPIATAGTGNFVVLMPNAYLNDIEYWGKVIQGVHNELTLNGCNMILTGIDISVPSTEGMPPVVNQEKVDGVITLGHLPNSYILLLRMKGIPLVMVDANFIDTNIDHVLANNYLGAYQAVTFLLKAGHRSLAFVGDPESALSFSERKRGFEKAALDFMQAHLGERVSTVLIEGMGVSGVGNYTSDSFAERIRSQLTAKQPVTGMFCANDMVALEVLNLLADWGINCPSDVSVCGFDDLAWGELANPKLTTVSVPRLELGKKAVQLVRRRFENPGVISELVLLPTTFVERYSIRTVD